MQQQLPLLGQDEASLFEDGSESSAEGVQATGDVVRGGVEDGGVLSGGEGVEGVEGQGEW